VRRIRISRPSPAMLVAVAALFVALGGTATAALVITGHNVRNGSLSGHDVRNGSLSGHDIRNGTVRAGDVKNGSLTSADLKPGTLGPRAFTAVAANGNANLFVTKNVGRISHPRAGVYCFYLGFQPVNVQATLNAGSPPSVDSIKATLIRDDAHGDACAGAESASVRIYNVRGTDAVLANAGFFVAFS